MTVTPSGRYQSLAEMKADLNAEHTSLTNGSVSVFPEPPTPSPAPKETPKADVFKDLENIDEKGGGSKLYLLVIALGLGVIGAAILAEEVPALHEIIYGEELKKRTTKNTAIPEATEAPAEDSASSPQEAEEGRGEE